MWIERVEQILRERRKLIIQPQLHAGIQVRDPLQQALDMRVGIGRRINSQPTGDLAMLLGKLDRAPTEIQKLVVIMPKQTWIGRGHVAAPA